METNWNGLTEDLKEIFFDFYMYIKFGNYNARLACPTARCEGCKTLFPGIGLRCPCHIYNEDAFKTVEDCLREDGWIK
jgi:hypothetical protein